VAYGEGPSHLIKARIAPGFEEDLGTETTSTEIGRMTSYIGNLRSADKLLRLRSKNYQLGDEVEKNWMKK